MENSTGHKSSSLFSYLIFLIVLEMWKNASANTAHLQRVEDFAGNSSCVVDGNRYKYGERIPREHPCHICLCVRGRAECAWQDCPLPPEGCTELTIPELCNPSLYLCNIPSSLANYENVRVIVRRGTDLQPDDLEDGAQRSGDCNIMGVPYRTGDVVGAASHHCLECRCGKQDLYCSPRCCFRPASFWETPGQIMNALVIGPKVPPKHPLHYLVGEDQSA